MENKSTSSASLPLNFLRERYLTKQKTNPQYSVSAYARDLGVSPSFLSRLLGGERPLTVKIAIQFATLFDLPTETVDAWVSNVISGSGKHAKISKKVREKLTLKSDLKAKYPIHHYEVERFKAVSQWYHFAILNLTFVKGFKSNASWIARRLAISTVQAQDAIARLLELGLLEKKNDIFKPTKNMIFVDQKKTDLSVRQFHREMCDHAKAALEDPSSETFDQQYFSGITMAFDRRRMPEIKEKLQALSQEMMRKAVSPEYTDLYHLNLQFFPLTKPKKDSSHE